MDLQVSLADLLGAPAQNHFHGAICLKLLSALLELDLTKHFKKIKGGSWKDYS